MDHRQQYLSSDPNFLLKYFDEMPSDNDSDDDFDGYISEDDSILIDSSTLISSNSSSILSYGSSSSSNSSSTLTNQLNPTNSSSGSSLPSLLVSGDHYKILPVINVLAHLRHQVDLEYTYITFWYTYVI